MGIVPKPLVERITFYQGRLAKMAENATAIGTTPEAVAALQAKVEAARAAYNAQQMAQQAARSATLALNIAIAEMSDAGASIIFQVRSKAVSTDDDGVYVLASLPAPAARSPMGAPGMPSQLSSALGGDGALILTWKCKNPRGSTGTLYHLHRRTSPAGGFEYLGVAGEKRYVDTTIPKGATAIAYQIQAIRSTAVGTSAIFNVNFGTNGNGIVKASMQQAGPLAA